MGISNGRPRSGVRLLPGIGRVGWEAGTFVWRKAWWRGRSRNGSDGYAGKTGRRRSLLRFPHRVWHRVRGPWKWNSRTASVYGYEAKPRWVTPEVRRILAYSKPMDLRKSIDGLVGLVKGVLGDFLKRVSQTQATKSPNMSPIWAVWVRSRYVAQRG